MTERATGPLAGRSSRRSDWLDAVLDTDPATQDRSIVLTQLLFGAAALTVFTTVMVFGPGEGSSVTFYLGLLLTFAACLAAILMRWSAHAPHLVLVLPVIDIFAIACMRHSQPELGLGLLWVFPVLWISTLVGAVGITASVILVGALVAAEFALRGLPVTLSAMQTLIFLPITLVFVAVSGRLHTRRNRAQRLLLSKQSGLLEGALAQARRQEELLAEVLNTVDFGVVRIDKSGQINLVNEAQMRMQLDERLADATALPVGGRAILPQRRPCNARCRGRSSSRRQCGLRRPTARRPRSRSPRATCTASSASTTAASSSPATSPPR
ncbi:hypothetical protein [Microterricola viridarii]|uniref:hypothetical protein n=1 Tax=Microterricola viridarii TaxID=412690 RepID=UPI000AD08DCC|nr:hypothetical protein [Microterricola viridarii]